LLQVILLLVPPQRPWARLPGYHTISW